MYEAVKFKLTGVCPLLMHNGQLANPLNPIVRKMKEITSKRKKTDSDLMELARLEFMGGLYVDDKGQPCVPGELIEAMLAKGAAESKLGKKFKAGLICDGNFKLEYEGPKDADKLWDNGKFRDTRGAKVGQSRVMRTRPIFHDWSLIVTVQFLPSVMNRSNVTDAMAIAGQLVGLGDYRPKFGRFQAEVMN